jgi:hypothetical protein
MRKISFAIAAIFIFLFAAGCTQQGCSISEKTIRAKSLCEQTGGGFIVAPCSDYGECHCGAGGEFDPTSGCIQPSADIWAGANLSNKAMQCKSVCEKSSGQFTMTPPGRTGVTFAWCEPYNATLATNYGCICDEPESSDPVLGCIKPDSDTGKMKALCERTNGAFSSSPCPPCPCGFDPFCACAPCHPSQCNCQPGMGFDRQLGCINKTGPTIMTRCQQLCAQTHGTFSSVEGVCKPETCGTLASWCLCPDGNRLTCVSLVNQSGCPPAPAAYADRIWYFAFGSNLNFDGMHSRVGSWPEVRRAILPKYMRTFAGAADIRSNSSSLVYGAIYILNESQMQSLDRYEGVASGNYRRINVTVIALGNESNETLPAVAYQYVQQRPFSAPSNGYLNTIIDGMHDNGYGDYEINLLLKEARRNST